MLTGPFSSVPPLFSSRLIYLNTAETQQLVTLGSCLQQLSSVSPRYSGTDGLCLSNIRRCDGEDTFENTVPELGDVFLTKEGLSWEVLPIWKKHVGLGIRKKTISYSKSILRGFLSAGLSFWWGSRTKW